MASHAFFAGLQQMKPSNLAGRSNQVADVAPFSLVESIIIIIIINFYQLGTKVLI